MRALFELVRFEHTLFALPFAFVGLLYASGGRPSVPVLGWTAACMVTARTCAMAFNRLADRGIDAANPRTEGRPLQRGAVTTEAAWALVVSCGSSFPVFAAMLNEACLVLAPIALAWLLAYSLTKRFTAWCHVWLGLALAMAPAGAWLGVTGSLEAFPILLAAAVTLWVAGFDVMYACEDAEVDRAQGLRSLPARIGVPRALTAAAVLHSLAVAALVAAGFVGRTGWAWHAGVAVAATILVAEHFLVRPDDLRRLNRAFFHANAAVSVTLLLFAFLDTRRGA